MIIHKFYTFYTGKKCAGRFPLISYIGSKTNVDLVNDVIVITPPIHDIDGSHPIDLLTPPGVNLIKLLGA